jgi:uncharacterized protein
LREIRLNLTVMEEIFGVCRLPPGSLTPDWAIHGPFVSVTTTQDETSIVCLQELVPQGTTVERDWRCIKVEGPLAFTQIGLLAALLAPLAEAQISIFAISTYDTDYLLLKEQNLESAIDALTQAGHAIHRKRA